MKYWWRELSGWLLIGLALFGFVLVYELALGNFLVEMCVFAVISLVVFWGGVQLLKVAIAARICQQAQDQLCSAENGKRAK